MKISLVLDNGDRHDGELVHDDRGACVRIMLSRCPHGCATKGGEVFVAGTGVKHHNHDTYFADAITRCCSKKIGTLEAEVSTIFGITEDEAVTRGPWKAF